ncbi:MAG TPA: glycerol-3-phosphate dehydrogenase/oxidase [Opitutaceae bacterium]
MRNPKSGTLDGALASSRALHTIPAMDRAANLKALSADGARFDMLIVGGGATGLGAAVDAAARGHAVALVEASDFGKGTSSRSTKLVHGGVRYLRQGNIPLVREALLERGRLTCNAPHLVHDRAFVIPNYKWWEGPFYGIGMKVYDGLAGEFGLANSEILDRDETIARIPTIETDGLTGGVIYHDGQFDDARLAISLARTADSLGATLINYCRCTGLVKHGGRIVGARLLDCESGAEFEVRCRVVLNATGVFVDSLRAMDEPASRPIVAVSQGIHLVLPRRFLPGDAAIMVPRTDDGRVLFAVPWHDRVVVGTTDTPRPAPELEPRALEEERQFVMTHIRRFLATDPTPEDVCSVFAGMRPLVAGDAGEGTATLSREHTILVSESGLATIIGGKWTTYRKMAEDVVDQIEDCMGITHRPCTTADMHLHGWSEDTGLAAHLEPYGSDGAAVVGVLQEHGGFAERLHPAFAHQRGEIAWHARHEMARTVEDVLARRTRALLLDARAAIEAAPAVAELLAAELGRDAAWQAAQVAEFTALARRYVFTDPESTERQEPR